MGEKTHKSQKRTKITRQGRNCLAVNSLCDSETQICETSCFHCKLRIILLTQEFYKDCNLRLHTELCQKKPKNKKQNKTGKVQIIYYAQIFI